MDRKTALRIEFLKSSFSSIVPQGYTRIEKVHFDGNHILDTQLLQNNTNGILIKYIKPMKNGTYNWSAIFGATNPDSYPNYGLGFYTSTTKWLAWDTGWRQFGTCILNNEYYDIKYNYLNDKKAVVNSDEQALSNMCNTNDRTNLVIGYFRNFTSWAYATFTWQRSFVGDLGDFEITKGTAVVGDFIAVEENATGKQGYYDKLNDRVCLLEAIS